MALNQIRGETQILPGSIPASKLNSAFAQSNGDIFVDKENHTAETNGTQVNFVLAHAPVVGSEHVFLRGTLRIDGYTVTGQTLNFSEAPAAGDDLAISYRKLVQ